jgi:hypothetical protein
LCFLAAKELSRNKIRELFRNGAETKPAFDVYREAVATHSPGLRQLPWETLPIEDFTAKRLRHVRIAENQTRLPLTQPRWGKTVGLASQGSYATLGYQPQPLRGKDQLSSNCYFVS